MIKCDVFVVFLSESYLARCATLYELAWAMEHGKKVSVVRHPETLCSDIESSSLSCSDVESGTTMTARLTPNPEAFQWVHQAEYLLATDNSTMV